MNGVELVASWLTPAVLFCVMNVMIGAIFFRSSLKPPRAKEELAAAPAPRLERVSSFLERVKSFNLSRYESERKPDPVYEAAREEEEEYHRVWRTRSVPAVEAAREVEEDTYHEIVEEPHQACRTRSVPAAEEAREEEEAFHETTEEPHRVGRTRSVPVQEAAREEEDEEAFHETEEPHHVERSRSVPVTAAAAREVYQQIVEAQHVEKAAPASPAAKSLKKSASEKMLTVKEKEEEDEEYERRPATARRRAAGEEVDGKANDFINKFRQQLKLQRMDSIVRYNEMIDRGAGR